MRLLRVILRVVVVARGVVPRGNDADVVASVATTVC